MDEKLVIGLPVGLAICIGLRFWARKIRTQATAQLDEFDRQRTHEAFLLLRNRDFIAGFVAMLLILGFSSRWPDSAAGTAFVFVVPFSILSLWRHVAALKRLASLELEAPITAELKKSVMIARVGFFLFLLGFLISMGRGAFG